MFSISYAGIGLCFYLQKVTEEILLSKIMTINYQILRSV